MRFTVEHRVPGRVRVSLLGHIPATDACALAQIIEQWDTVTSCTIYPRTGSIAITHTNNGDARRPSEAPILKQLSRLTPAEVARHRPTEAHLQAAHPHQFALPLWQQIAGLVVRRALVRLLLPLPLRFVYQLICALSFIRDALHSLRHGRLDVPVLDAAAITTALIQRKPDDAGSIMFMLTLGETMEQHARGRTQLELIHTLLDMPELVWRLSPESKIYADTDVAAAPTIVPLTTSIATPAPATEPLEEAPVPEPTPALEPAPTSDAVLVPATALVPGDLIVVRTSSPVPVDGKVLRGRALVNQNSLTGEPLPIERTVDDTVFAGTVVEEGELIIEVSATVEKTRIRQVVSLVEQSELLRPEGQIRLENLANRFVPYNFLYAGLLLAFTRSLERAATALMVDYSCALKLTGSISSLAALREAARMGITVKGARSLEALAQATTLVFDKTGTLTQTTPQVAEVLAFNGWEKREVLRLAACLEEHFPHSVARAVVNEAAAQGLNHREQHATVKYLVAHGIVSTLEGKRVVIGSGHFVFEDENVAYPAHIRNLVESRAAHGSPLFLAVDGQLVGVIRIHDPLKPGIARTVSQLRELGFRRIIMLTGDNAGTAARIAEEAGISEFAADLLPEQKYTFLEQLRASGEKVAMVGDGVNDSPALSCADVGIAMSDGAAIAREVANITLGSSDLEALVHLRKLSQGLAQRMQRSFRWTMLLNTALLVLGGVGILQASTSSLIHNSSTVLLCMNSTRPYT